MKQGKYQKEEGMKEDKETKFNHVLWGDTEKMPMGDELLKLFIRFLHKYKIYSKYIYNSLTFFNTGIRRKKRSAYSYICEAFAWQNTPEGYSFWSVMDNEWNIEIQKYIDNLKNKTN